MCAQDYTFFVHPEDRENAKNEFSKLLETNVSSNFENRHITKSGKIKWLSWNAIYVPEHNNIYAVAKDITDNKELEDLLQKVNELARIGGWEWIYKTIRCFGLILQRTLLKCHQIINQR